MSTISTISTHPPAGPRPSPVSASHGNIRRAGYGMEGSDAIGRNGGAQAISRTGRPATAPAGYNGYIRFY
jgi:hypothetical protein